MNRINVAIPKALYKEVKLKAVEDEATIMSTVAKLLTDALEVLPDAIDLLESAWFKYSEETTFGFESNGSAVLNDLRAFLIRQKRIDEDGNEVRQK